MRYTILIIVIALFTLTGTAHAQPDSLWSRTYGGDESIDYCKSVILSGNDGFVMAGAMEYWDSTAGFYYIEVNEEGEVQNERVYYHDRYSYCEAICKTSNGGYALVGFTQPDWIPNAADILFVIIDAEGELLYSNTYGGDRGEDCHSVIQTSDGGFALGGCTHSFGDGSRTGYLIKTNDEGEIQWTQTYEPRLGPFEIFDIVQTDDGGFFLAGLNFYLVRTDADGEVLWADEYDPGEGSSVCFSIAPAGDDGVALAGFCYNRENNSIWDFGLVRVDGEGNELWSRKYGGDFLDWCYQVLYCTDGGFILAGRTEYSYGQIDRDFYLVRTDSVGNLIWETTFGGDYGDVCYSVVQTDDGGYALAGSTTSFGGGEGDFWLVKTGPDPVSVPPSSLIPYPSSLILLDTYPNPFNSATTISYGLPFPSQVTLRIYNQSGQRITTLFDGYEQPGFHATNLNATNLPTGLYFVRLEAENLHTVGKIHLIR